MPRSANVCPRNRVRYISKYGSIRSGSLTTLSGMAMGTRRRQPWHATIWVAMPDLPIIGGHRLYERLTLMLDDPRFDAFNET